MKTEHDEDLIRWLTEQAAALRAGRLEDLDRENLASEIECVARDQVRELEARLATLIAHLVMQDHVRLTLGLHSAIHDIDRQEFTWQASVRQQRAEIHLLLADSPSLQNYFADQAWCDRVRRQAARRSFGADPVWSMEQVLSPDFFPCRSP